MSQQSRNRMRLQSCQLLKSYPLSVFYSETKYSLQSHFKMKIYYFLCILSATEQWPDVFIYTYAITPFLFGCRSLVLGSLRDSCCVFTFPADRLNWAVTNFTTITMPSFLLVFSDDPPAADVVREDFIVSKTADNKCVFRWVKDAKKDPVGVPVSGRILREGMKKDMRVLKVDVSGTITQGAGLGTRKQELEKARLRAAYAQKHNLQELAENMLHLGIDELAQQLNPTKRVKRPKTPKKRNPAQIALVNGQLNNMPCFKNGPHKIEVWEGKGVYCPEGFLTTARLRYGLQPLSLFRTILRILFPTRFRLLDGASYSGKYCTVAVPPKLIESI
ncbi:hypothetical protein FOCC_FOCC001104, partial [Frankliniella occidentalis]